MSTNNFGRDPLALTVLALFSEQPRHPWEIQHLIRKRRKDFAMPNIRGLYRMIERLADAGFIEAAETTREGNRPERTVYRLTDQGELSFPAWLTDLVATPIEEHESFAVAIGLLGYLPTGVALEALQVRATSLRAVIAALDVELAGMSTMLPRLLLLELEYARSVRQAELAWVDSVTKDILAGRLAWDALALVELGRSLEHIPSTGPSPALRLIGPHQNVASR
jgi:DNA-binding PadR family transcriptional regulator